MQSRFDWLSAVAGALFGLMAGYVIGQDGRRASWRPPASPPPPPQRRSQRRLPTRRCRRCTIRSAASPVTRRSRSIRGTSYDAGRYQEAIGHYQKALELDPKNVSVSTDLGTALWASGPARRRAEAV